MSKCWFYGLLFLTTFLLIGQVNGAEDEKKLDFAHDVAPLIKKHCGKCHTNGNYKGSFSMDTREELLEASVISLGSGKESELVKRLLSQDVDERMPPEGDRLSEKEIAIFEKWIDEGIKWEEGFTFKVSSYTPPLKLRKVELPPAIKDRNHPIDRIVDAYAQKQNVVMPEGISDAEFARRVSLDLIGLLPDEESVKKLVEGNSAADREKYAASLLAESRLYADHWVAFWHDLLRNEYRGTGYIDGGRKPITNWVYQALAENKPYDQFVRELITPVPEAEGFIAGIKWRGRINASQVPEIQFSQNVSQVFFGINMKCASCHDSFIDSWKLTDAYGMAAIIADQPLEIHRCDKGTGQMAKAAFLWPELGAVDAEKPKAERLAQFASLVTHPDNGRFSRTIANRIWHRLMGRGIVHPVDAMGTEPWSEELLDYLAGYLIENKYDLKKLMLHIVSSEAYQSRIAPKSEVAPDKYVFKGPETRRMTAEQFVDGIWAITKTGPGNTDSSATLAPFSPSVPSNWQFIRASLVHSNDLMRDLGRPNREQVVTSRPETLTTLEALSLSNGQTLSEMVRVGSEKLVAEFQGKETKEIVSALYWRSLSRSPSDRELEVTKAFLGEKPDATQVGDVLWSIIALPEFQLNH